MCKQKMQKIIAIPWRTQEAKKDFFCISPTTQ